MTVALCVIVASAASLALIGVEKKKKGCSDVFDKVLLVIAAPVDVLICVCI